MKVIKRVPWKYSFTCEACSSELETEPDDVHGGSFGSFDEFEMQYWVHCAVCKTRHKINENKIPQDIKNNAL